MKTVVTSPAHVAVATTGTALLTEDKDRRYLRIKNLGPTNFVELSFDAQGASGVGVRLAANEVWEPRLAPINAIFGRADTLGVNVEVTTGK